MKYYINYHTGAGNEYVDGDIDEAKKAADAGAAYTQEPITIHDAATDTEIARRSWYGVKFNKNEDDAADPILFGDFGYYDDWAEC